MWEQPRGGKRLLKERCFGAALLQIRRDVTNAMRVIGFDRNRSAIADDRKRRRKRQRRMARHRKQSNQGHQGQTYSGKNIFHFLLTQVSIQSKTVLYQSTLFCGFNTQCPSSGKINSFEGTFCNWRAVNSSRPCV